MSLGWIKPFKLAQVELLSGSGNKKLVRTSHLSPGYFVREGLIHYSVQIGVKINLTKIRD